MRDIIIDTDPGIDDAAAIIIALSSKKLNVKLITSVAGNVGIKKTTLNVLKLVEFCGENIPVAKGASQPLLRSKLDAEWVHGKSGMDGYDFPTPTEKPLDCHAITAMRDVIMSNENKITIVPIGPMTNIALLLRVYPEVTAKIEEIVFMGGSIDTGNTSPMAEFNIFADPEAAKIVFGSGIPLVMVGLNIGRKAVILKEQSEQLKNASRAGKMIYSLFMNYRSGSLESGFKMFDSTAIAYLCEPEMYVTKKCFADVETSSPLTYGCTVVDTMNMLEKAPNLTVCMDIDEKRFREWFVEEISKID